MSEPPLVAVIMGSKSDWETMRHADEMLIRLGVPHEWGWTYTMLIMLPVLFLLTDAGRSFGVDAFLAPPLDRAAARGSRLARLIRWLV